MTAVIPRNIVNQILAHAQASPEDEVCGMVAQKDGRLTHCYPVENVAGDTGHFFRMDPGQQISTMRKMREQNEELGAIYHSHPHSPAQPSVTDMQESNYPDVLYLIVSLNITGVLEIRGFSLKNQEVEEQELVLE
jgi:proteasome lid subunit RPN8/RPN11